MRVSIPNIEAAFDIVWDDTGIVHVYANTVADSYRGMGYAAGYERLWQIHLSTAYAQGEAANLLGERFVAQDLIQRACNVSGSQTGMPQSDGDWIVDAYLDGLNAYVDEVAASPELPPEFVHAGATPRHFTRADIAARYRFTAWFQHKSWTEKMVVGRLMARHGVDWFKHHLLHFSQEDAQCIATLAEPLKELSLDAIPLAYPDFNVGALVAPATVSGSNNWAVTGEHSVSGMPLLASDPHQPHTIPNTFFYVHLHAGDWDAFGAAFPGVPYFMIGYTRDIAWGLTTGFIDSYDVYIEQLKAKQYRTPNGWQDLQTHNERIDIKGGEHREFSIESTAHGPLLESLTDQLGLSEASDRSYSTALHWSLANVPTSAGALAQLPLAKSAEQFGAYLFEDDVCPLVNNIICVDRQNALQRFIAATLPARHGVTGSVPLPGWDKRYDFARSTRADLTVEKNPDRGFSLTANNDTMGSEGPYPIHTFPAHSARADRIQQILEEKTVFSVDDFKAAQADLTDNRALQLLPDLLRVLENGATPALRTAHAVLSAWNGEATADAAAPCLYYPFMDRNWHRKFMREVLKDSTLNAIPGGAPGLNLFSIGDFLKPGSPWQQHQDVMQSIIHQVMSQVVQDVQASLGEGPQQWRWGDLHQISFSHRLVKQPTWASLHVGPDEIGGSANTLAMAMHLGPGPGQAQAERGEVACRVYHGPSFRMIVDLADPDHTNFVIAGGNGGRSESPFTSNQYKTWLHNGYFTLNLRREEIQAYKTVEIR